MAKYANINTQAITDSLPTTYIGNGYTVTGATIDNWKVDGWRIVRNIEEPVAGYRVNTYTTQIVNDDECDLVIESQTNIAEEQSAAIAAEKAVAKDFDFLRDSSPVGKACYALAVEVYNLKKASNPDLTTEEFKNQLRATIDAMQQ